VSFFGDEIEEITSFDPFTGKTLNPFDRVFIYPANIFVTTRARMQSAMNEIQDDMVKQVDFFRELGKYEEAKRLEERVTYDMEMLRELGIVPALKIIRGTLTEDRRDTGHSACLIIFRTISLLS
jgi:excinuclease ABC subunit B